MKHLLRTSLLAALALVTLATCTDSTEELSTRAPTSTTTTTTTSPEYVRHTLGPGSWEGARTSADGRRIVVVIVGGRVFREDDPCTVAYEGRATETAEDVRVSITGRSPRPPRDGVVACTSEGHFRTVTADLREPLGRRRLIDEQFDRAQPVFDGTQLAEPSWLPPAYSLQREGPGRFERAGGSATSWQRHWGPERPPPTDNRCTPSGSVLLLMQEPPTVVDSYPTNGDRAVRTHDVRGVVATYYDGGHAASARLTWVESGRGFVLGTMQGCVGDVPVAEDALVRVARSLAVPPARPS